MSINYRLIDYVEKTGNALSLLIEGEITSRHELDRREAIDKIMDSLEWLGESLVRDIAAPEDIREMIEEVEKQRNRFSGRHREVRIGFEELIVSMEELLETA